MRWVDGLVVVVVIGRGHQNKNLPSMMAGGKMYVCLREPKKSDNKKNTYGSRFVFVYILLFHLLLSKLTVLINSLQTALEVTEVQLSAKRNLNLGDLLGVLLELSSSSNSVVNVLIVKGVTRNSETDKVKNTLTLFFILLIPLEGKWTKLARTDTIETDHLDAEADTAKVIDLHRSALEELSHVQVDCMATRRHNNTVHTSLDHIDCKLADLEATVVHVLGEEDLTETDSKSECIAATDTTVSGVTIAQNLDLLQADTDVTTKELGELLLEETVVTEAEHTTHVAKTILL